jgi:hypothetical protein
MAKQAEPRRYSPGEEVSRAEHIAWCKQRALEYLDAGDAKNALTSMMSDLRKHPGTTKHLGITLGVNLVLAGRLHNHAELRKWIEGFN